jgi:hypothetical protein
LAAVYPIASAVEGYRAPQRFATTGVGFGRRLAEDCPFYESQGTGSGRLSGLSLVCRRLYKMREEWGVVVNPRHLRIDYPGAIHHPPSPRLRRDRSAYALSYGETSPRWQRGRRDKCDEFGGIGARTFTTMTQKSCQDNEPN